MGLPRVILHSDLNSFYASVEVALDPSLRGRPVAVCGSAEERHGIVLAKSEQAKKAGVKTGMATWEAKRLCPDLVVLRPNFEEYLKYSRMARDIYRRYTDRVEPFGLDECWLDLTGCWGRWRSGEEAADEIRLSVREELGLTVSVGVSFNKVFAKLGSDMKKPDAVTVITGEDYREKVWPLPASDLIYVGRATARKLSSYGIRTIGDIARADPAFLKSVLGVAGVALWTYASGNDSSPVMPDGYRAPIKSIGQGVTCVSDLSSSEEVWKVMLQLSQDVGRRLRQNGLMARGVQVSVRDSALEWAQYQTQLEVPTRSPMEMAKCARKLFEARYKWILPVRAVAVRAINLVPETHPVQMTLFDDWEKRERRERLEAAVDEIRERFGKNAIYSACLMGDLKMPGWGAPASLPQGGR